MMRFDGLLRPEKGVCHLQGFARTSATVDALPFGQIWFQSVLQIQRTDVLTDWATRKHLPSSSLAIPSRPVQNYDEQTRWCRG